MANLENLQMEQNETLDLAKEMKELKVLETEVSEASTAKSAIENLSDEKLANYIISELQEGGLWLNYSDMKSKNFFGFMVQASINSMGKKLGNKKYDENGNESNDGKTIIQWMGDYNGIDNKYGGGTSKMVKMIQKCLGIKEDGKAGPQYFAYVCAALTDDSKFLTNFKVAGTDNYSLGAENSGEIESLINNSYLVKDLNCGGHMLKLHYKKKMRISEDTVPYNGKTAYKVNVEGDPNDYYVYYSDATNYKRFVMAPDPIPCSWEWMNDEKTEGTLNLKGGNTSIEVTKTTETTEIGNKNGLILDCGGHKLKLYYDDGITVDNTSSEYNGKTAYKVNVEGDPKNYYVYYSDATNYKRFVMAPDPIPCSWEWINDEKTEGKLKLKKINHNDKEHWAENINDEISDNTEEFINRYRDFIKFDSNQKKEYIKTLNNILNDINKKATLYSLMNLGKNFRGDFKLNLDRLKSFDTNVGSSKFDSAKKNLVFEISEENDDYLTYQNGKLVKQHECGKGSVFEVDGSHRFDDYKFDSVEAFFAFLDGKKIISARKNVKESANEGLETYNKRFDASLINNPKKLDIIGSVGSKQYKTFLSMLSLPDKFWESYKLTENDIKNFKKGMEKDIFDWETGTYTVFHQESNKFEVDGTGVFKDKQFNNISEFFSRLSNEV